MFAQAKFKGWLSQMVNIAARQPEEKPAPAPEKSRAEQDMELRTMTELYVLQNTHAPSLDILGKAGVKNMGSVVGNALFTASRFLDLIQTAEGCAITRDGKVISNADGECYDLVKQIRLHERLDADTAAAIWSWIYDFAATGAAPNLLPRMVVSQDAQDGVRVVQNVGYNGISGNICAEVFHLWAEDMTAPTWKDNELHDMTTFRVLGRIPAAIENLEKAGLNQEKDMGLVVGKVLFAASDILHTALGGTAGVITERASGKFITKIQERVHASESVISAVWTQMHAFAATGTAPHLFPSMTVEVKEGQVFVMAAAEKSSRDMTFRLWMEDNIKYDIPPAHQPASFLRL